MYHMRKLRYRKVKMTCAGSHNYDVAELGYKSRYHRGHKGNLGEDEHHETYS